MLLDASAIVAIMRPEPEANALIARLAAAQEAVTHAVSVFEASTAIARIKNCPIQHAQVEV